MEIQMSVPLVLTCIATIVTCVGPALGAGVPTPAPAVKAAPDAAARPPRGIPNPRNARNFRTPLAKPPAPVPAGKVYYVDASLLEASDENPGSEARPWRTIRKAAASAQAGETVYVKADVYQGTVEFAHSGSEGNWITLAAYPGDEHKAIVEDGTILMEQKSYIRVYGLKIQNTGGQGFWVVGPASHITLSYNHTYNTKQSGIRAMGVPLDRPGVPGDPSPYKFRALTDVIIENNLVESACNGGYNECITVDGGVDGFEVRGNKIFGQSDNRTGGEGIDLKYGVSNGKVHHNEICDRPRKICIYVDGGGGNRIRHWAEDAVVRDIEIHSNIIHDNPGWGIVLRSEGRRGSVANFRIYNNVIYRCRGGIGFSGTPFQKDSPLTNVYVVNNTVYGNATGGISLSNSLATNTVYRNNISLDNGPYSMEVERSGEGIVQDHNLFEGEAVFVDPAAGDFRLREGSLAVGAGSPEGAPATDFSGKSRPAGKAVDIGAFGSAP